MSNQIHKQSAFTRTQANEGKMGAYYTDVSHCKWISKFLEFPEEVCCLEPSIGDGKAIFNIVPEHAKIFGVELNSEVAKVTSQNERIEKLISDDFLRVKVSHKSFSFCFCNPPYGTVTNLDRPMRLERLFLDRLTPYLKQDAVLVYVIPHSVLINPGFLRAWTSRFDTKGIYKFHDEEYDKFQQIVIFGVKKSPSLNETEYENIINSYSIEDDVPLLPEDYEGEKLIVPSSSTQHITMFTTQEFNKQAALRAMQLSPLNKITNQLGVEEYTIGELTSPVIPLKKDLMYLVGVAGGGEGYAGSEENADIHLQRGVVKQVESEELEKSGEKQFIRVTQTNAVAMTIIQNDGTITRLE